jgi:hypothetical protein
MEWDLALRHRLGAKVGGGAMIRTFFYGSKGGKGGRAGAANSFPLTACDGTEPRLEDSERKGEIGIGRRHWFFCSDDPLRARPNGGCGMRMRCADDAVRRGARRCRNCRREIGFAKNGGRARWEEADKRGSWNWGELRVVVVVVVGE